MLLFQLLSRYLEPSSSMSQVQEGYHPGTVCDSRRGQCDTAGARTAPPAVRRTSSNTPLRRNFGRDGRSRRTRGGMLVCGGRNEQCLQRAETAADRTTTRTGCGTRNRNRPLPPEQAQKEQGLQMRAGLQPQQPSSGSRLSVLPRYTFKSGAESRREAMFIMGAEWPHHCLQWCVAAPSDDTSGPGTLGL